MMSTPPWNSTPTTGRNSGDDRGFALRRFTFAAILLTMIVSVCRGQGQSPNSGPPAKKEPPLTLENVIGMLRGGVSSADILKEVALRKLGFEVSAEVLTQLEKETASRYLLNHIGLHSKSQLPPNWVHPDKLRQEKKWAELIEQLNAVINREPRALDLINMRAEAYVESGRFEDAIADYQLASKYDPENPAYTLKLAGAYQRGGDARRAVLHATSVIEDRTFNMPTSYLVRGRAYVQLRKYREAKDDLQVALQRMPLDFESHLELACLLIACPDNSLRQLSAGQQLLKVAESLEKPDSLASDVQRKFRISQAALAASQGQYDEAIRELEKTPRDQRTPDEEEQLTHYRDRKPWYLPAGAVSDAFIPNIGAYVASRMARIEGGEFKGANGQVQTVKPFLIGKFEITNQEWAAVMGQSLVGRAAQPRDFISLDDAREFTRRLNAAIGQPMFRLPTEVEWEWAARSGTATRFHFGDDPMQLPEFGWSDANAEATVHDVGLLKESPWGLYDTYGNVAEWCDVAPDPASGTSPAADFAVLRGGSAFNSQRFCDSAARITAPARDRRRGVGMRLAAEPVPLLEKLVALENIPKFGLDGAIASLEQNLGSSNDVARDQNRLAILYYVRACSHVANKQHAQALADFTAVLRQGNPVQPTARSWGTLIFLARCQRAWLLATTDLPSVRNVRQAREDAETALSVCEGGHWAPHAVLAAVSAAEGAFDKAEQREAQVLPLAERTDLPWSGVEFAESSRGRMKKYKAREAITGGELLIPLSAITR